MNVSRDIALEVFGLKEGFTEKDIEAQYKKLAKITHPDAGGDDNLFRFVKECKNILTHSSSSSTQEQIERFIILQQLYDSCEVIGAEQTIETLEEFNVTEIRARLSIQISPLFRKDLTQVINQTLVTSTYDFKLAQNVIFCSNIRYPKEIQKFSWFRISLNFLAASKKFIIFKQGFHSWQYKPDDCFHPFPTTLNLTFKY